MSDIPLAPDYRLVGRFSGEYKGSAFLAILLLFGSAVSHLMAANPRFSDISLDSVTFTMFIPALTFLCCLILSYDRRFRRFALVIWLVMALFCVLVSWSQSHWGDGAVDGTETMRIRYSRYSFLAECLFAYASIILLLTNVMIIANHWRRRAP